MGVPLLFEHEFNGLNELGTMKKLLIIAAVMMLTACNTTRKGRTTENVDGSAFDVIVVDSCEYLIGDCGYSGYMAHKGNCKYCEQRRKK